MNFFVQRWLRRLSCQADEHTRNGDHRRAAEVHEELCRGLERHLDEAHPKILEQLQLQAACSRRAGDLQAAEAIHQRLLRLLQRCHGADHLAVAQHLNVMGVLACEMGRHHHATELYQRALRAIRCQLGSDDPRLAALHHNLGTAYHSLDQPQAAEHHYREALRRLADHRPSAEHADCLRDLAELLDPRQPTLARQHLQDSLRELRQAHGHNSAELAPALIRVAGSFFRLRHVQDARALLCEAAELLAAMGPAAQDQLTACRQLIAQCGEPV